MELHDRRRRGIGRDDRLRAVLCSRAALRTVVLSGLFGVAWLAGVASAHADSGADSDLLPAISDQLSSVQSTSIDSASAQSEQAALATDIQLESDASSQVETEQRTPDRWRIAEPMPTFEVDAATKQSTSDTVSHARSSLDPSLAITSTNTPLAASDHSSVHDPGARITGLEHVHSSTSPVLNLVTGSLDSVLSSLKAEAESSVLMPSWTSPEGEGFADGSAAEQQVGNSVRNAVPSSAWSHDSAESLHNGTSPIPGDEGTATGSETISLDQGRSTQSPLVRFGFETSCLKSLSVAQCAADGVPKNGMVVDIWDTTEADRDAKVSRIALRTAWQGYESERMARPFVSPD